jgi:diketogulonate reductase-like aldo/keto reductase
MFENPTLQAIGNTYHKSVAQVILRWLIQRNVVALVKSTHIERMKENFEIFDFALSENDREQIATLDTQTSLFFNHQTPEAVDLFVKFIEERKNR